jgi:hypothetical protein
MQNIKFSFITAVIITLAVTLLGGMPAEAGRIHFGTEIGPTVLTGYDSLWGTNEITMKRYRFWAPNQPNFHDADYYFKDMEELGLDRDWGTIIKDYRNANGNIDSVQHSTLLKKYLVNTLPFSFRMAGV